MQPEVMLKAHKLILFLHTRTCPEKGKTLLLYLFFLLILLSIPSNVLYYRKKISALSSVMKNKNFPLYFYPQEFFHRACLVLFLTESCSRPRLDFTSFSCLFIRIFGYKYDETCTAQ